jgi:hypothetical protein
MAMLGRLDQDIEVSVKVRPRPAARRKRMVSRVKRSVPQPLAVAKKSEGR